MEKLKYQKVSIGIMNEQINLRLPQKLLFAARKQSEKKGYGSIQEFIKEAIRDKVFGNEELSPEEHSLIKKIIEKNNKNNSWVSEEKLFSALRK